MTPRSPNQHPPKTTTISRRLRQRADQNISVQPPPILHHKSARSNHPAPQSSPYPVTSNPPTTRPPVTTTWEGAYATPDIRRNYTSQPRDTSSDHLSSFTSSQPLDQAQDQRQNFEFFTPQLENLQQYQSQPKFESNLVTTPATLGSNTQRLELPASASSERSGYVLADVQDMSTLGFMMVPPQYSLQHHDSAHTTYSPNYAAGNQPYSSQRYTTAPSHSSYYPSSGGLSADHQPQRTEEMIALPPYQPQLPSLPRSPYEQHPTLGSMRTASSAMSTPQSFSYTAPHPQLPSQPLSGNPSAYQQSPIYPPTSYPMSDYHQHASMYPSSSASSTTIPSYDAAHNISSPSSNAVPALSSSPNPYNSAVLPRVLNSRPKPQCWEHGCNGRQFSTFSNLLRHQREKSGTASKSYCPRCGAEFTRTTARNGHMAHDKCKPRRPSESSR